MKLTKFSMAVFFTAMLVSNNSLSQTFRALFFNSNVYRTYVPLKGKRIMNIKSKEVLNDTITYTLSVDRPQIEGSNQQKGNSNVLDYKIINEDDNGFVVIRIFPCLVFDGVIVKYDLDCSASDPPSNYYFSVKKSDFIPMSKVLMSNKIFATPLIMPVKFRPSKGEIGFSMTGEFTAGYAFGLRQKISKSPYGQSFVSFIPLTIGISSGKYFTRNDDATYSAKTDSWATSFAYGVLFTVQRVNFGIFGGADYMVGDQKDWFYQGEKWYSIGIGYKLKPD